MPQLTLFRNSVCIKYHFIHSLHTPVSCQPIRCPHGHEVLKSGQFSYFFSHPGLTTFASEVDKSKQTWQTETVSFLDHHYRLKYLNTQLLLSLLTLCETIKTCGPGCHVQSWFQWLHCCVVTRRQSWLFDPLF